MPNQDGLSKETPHLIDACRHGRADAVAAFLENGADVNEPKTDGSGATPFILHCLPKEGHTEVASLLLANQWRGDE